MERVDVLAITALQSEYETLRTVATSTSRSKRGVLEWSERESGTDAPYLLGKYDVGNGGSFTLALARPTRMGGTSTGSIAAALVERLSPKCLAMSGVCAGNPSIANIGDVVVADRTYRYEEGKRTSDDFAGDIHQTVLNDRWVRAAQDLNSTDLACYGLPSPEDRRLWVLERLLEKTDPKAHPGYSQMFSARMWRSDLKNLEGRALINRESHIPQLTTAGLDYINKRIYEGIDSPKRLPLKVIVAPMASGDVVVKDAVTWTSLTRNVRTLAAIEMEAATIASTAWRLGVPNWLVVKGVMDFGDQRKNDRYKEFASRSSAEVLLRLLSDLVTTEGEVNEPTEDRGPLPTSDRDEIVERRKIPHSIDTSELGHSAVNSGHTLTYLPDLNLSRRVTQRIGATPVWVTGPSGVGKSRFAVEYMRENLNDNAFSLWLDATTSESLENSAAGILEALPNVAVRSSALDTLAQALRTSSDPGIIVLDNVTTETEELVTGLMGQGLRHQYLATTQTWRAGRLRLGLMKETGRTLRWIAENFATTERESKGILDYAGGLPIALVSVGAAKGRRGAAAPTRRRRSSRTGAVATEDKQAAAAERAIATNIRRAIDLTSRRTIAMLCSCAASPIPFSVLDHEQLDTKNFEDVLGLLAANIDVGRQHFTLHDYVRLIGLTVIGRRSMSDGRDALKEWLRAVDKPTPALAPHVLALADPILALDVSAELLAAGYTHTSSSLLDAATPLAATLDPVGVDAIIFGVVSSRLLSALDRSAQAEATALQTLRRIEDTPPDSIPEVELHRAALMGVVGQTRLDSVTAAKRAVSQRRLHEAFLALSAAVATHENAHGAYIGPCTQLDFDIARTTYAGRLLLSYTVAHIWLERQGDEGIFIEYPRLLVAPETIAEQIERFCDHWSRIQDAEMANDIEHTLIDVNRCRDAIRWLNDADELAADTPLPEDIVHLLSLWARTGNSDGTTPADRDSPYGPTSGLGGTVISLAELLDELQTRQPTPEDRTRLATILNRLTADFEARHEHPSPALTDTALRTIERCGPYYGVSRDDTVSEASLKFADAIAETADATLTVARSGKVTPTTVIDHEHRVAQLHYKSGIVAGNKARVIKALETITVTGSADEAMKIVPRIEVAASHMLRGVNRGGPQITPARRSESIRYWQILGGNPDGPVGTLLAGMELMERLAHEANGNGNSEVDPRVDKDDDATPNLPADPNQIDECPPAPILAKCSREEVKKAIRALSPHMRSRVVIARRILHQFGHASGYSSNDSMWAHRACVILGVESDVGADDIAFERHCLGHCYEAHGDRERALAQYQASYRMLRASFGEMHFLIPELTRHIDELSQ